MGRRLRTFVAVGLDAAVRNRLVALQEKLGRLGPDVKWVEPENLHVTLLFLGEVDDREVLDVCRVVSRVTETLAPFEAGVAGVGAFPNARRPRTLWAGVADGAAELVRLHDALESPLLEMGCYRREDRGYTPHVTLGRLKGDGAAEPFAAALAGHADWQGGRVAVQEVLVMSSELGPAGPTYTVLSRGELAG